MSAILEPLAVGQYVMIAVGDTGTGMDRTTVDRVFEPFFTTKESGKGAGLGLSQGYGLVRQSSGQVRIYSGVGEGATASGYRVLDAPDAALILDGAVKVDLPFTAVVMPGGVNGRQLAEEALRRRPELKVLFRTGYTRNAIMHHGRLDPGIDFIGKPYSFADLGAKVRLVLHRTPEPR